MVLTKEELIAALKHEVHILVHLAGKVDKTQLDYRPSPKQRSILELLQYMAIAGPIQVRVIQAGDFERSAMSAAWSPAEAAAKKMDFDQAVAAIAAQSAEYERMLSGWSDDDFRANINMFGNVFSKGAMLINLVLGAHAAYRMQLFLYLKATGRDDLNTMNLWAGADGPA